MYFLCFLRTKTSVNHKQLNESFICLSIIQTDCFNSVYSFLNLKTLERTSKPEIKDY